MSDEPIVRCGECLTNLADPLNTPLEQRKPCPECGSLRRNVAVTLATTVMAGVDVTVIAPTATATASALTPEAKHYARFLPDVRERNLGLLNAYFAVGLVSELGQGNKTP